MGLSGLSLEQAPPIFVPLRFFLTAPLFMLLAALLLLAVGPAVFASRWSPPLLALTHLFTLGFMAMVMMGALLQMLPVLAGSPVSQPRLVAGLVHSPLVGGVLLLGGGFLSGRPLLFQLAVVALASSFLVFIVAVARSLLRVSARNATVVAMRYAVAALAVTVTLGLTLGSAFGWQLGLPLLSLTDLHAAWGLLGWVSLLMIGVAYQVVPMFQLTPAYPRPFTRWLVGGLFALLLLWSVGAWFGGWFALPAVFGLMLGLVLFGAATLYLQTQGKRRRPDVSVQFWRVGMAAMLAAAALWSAGWFLPVLQNHEAYSVVLGILFIFGFAVSAINGMLYKIVPFLVWFHLFSRKDRKGGVPNMKEIIPDQAARRHLFLHLAALLLILAGVAWPAPMVYPAALALGLSAVLLGANLWGAYRVYREHISKSS